MSGAAALPLMEQPRVTIVIPVYNGADFLKEAIESALAQTYPNIEILVVNDGSNDHGATEEIARSFGTKIRYISKVNGGVASALNLALAEMEGEYFSWLSHDDLYVPQKIAREMDVVWKRRDKRTVVYSDYSVFTTSLTSSVAYSLRTIDPEHFRYWLTVENSLHGCTLLVPKAAFIECGTFDETLRTTQDYDLWFRMAKEFAFIHLPEALVNARIHSEQSSIKLAPIAMAECNTLLAKFVKSLTREELVLASGNAPAVAYAFIARNLLGRGFYKAARCSMLEAYKSLGYTNLRTGVDALWIFLRGRTFVFEQRLFMNSIDDFVRRIARKVLPTRLRETIRASLARSAVPKPILYPSVDTVRNLELKDKFSEVYAKNIFGGSDSLSGAGSDLLQTEVIRHEIPRVLRENGVSSMLDAPCGDWFWMRKVDLGIDRYIGVDIVDALITKNQIEFGRKGVEFRCLDLSKDTLPKADLIFSRDCLVHLSFRDAARILQNFKTSGARFLLTTTFTKRAANVDLDHGFWRPLNMEMAPFNFPQPIEVINEKCTEGANQFADKSLGLWRLDSITVNEKYLCA